MSYTTRQQQAVLSCMQAHRGDCVTAQALSEALRQQGLSVGLATVYRQLEKLTDQGQVHKISTDEGTCYQLCDHAEGDCFLLKCEHCGHIAHLDCDQLRPLYRHLEEAHDFVINPRKTMLYGLCGPCFRRKETK